MYYRLRYEHHILFICGSLLFVSLMYAVLFYPKVNFETGWTACGIGKKPAVTRACIYTYCQILFTMVNHKLHIWLHLWLLNILVVLHLCFVCVCACVHVYVYFHFLFAKCIYECMFTYARLLPLMWILFQYNSYALSLFLKEIRIFS